jgi:hypothetical protein
MFLGSRSLAQLYMLLPLGTAIEKRLCAAEKLGSIYDHPRNLHATTVIHRYITG